MEEYVEGLPTQVCSALPGQSWTGLQDWSRKGTAQPWPLKCLCCRTETKPWSTMVVLRRTIKEMEHCFIRLPLLSYHPASGSGTATVVLSHKPNHPLLPQPSRSLGDAPVSPDPELCSDACAGPGLLTFP